MHDRDVCMNLSLFVCTYVRAFILLFPKSKALSRRIDRDRNGSGKE